jgi:hypothetical protein
VNNPEHVLADFVAVYYDPRFAYNVVRAPEGMEHLSVYENPALPHTKELIASGDPDAGVWVPATLVTGPDHNRERRARNQAAEAEVRTIHVPATVRVTSNTATTTRAERLAPSVSTRSTQWYSAVTREWPDADDATWMDTSRRRSASEPSCHLRTVATIFQQWMMRPQMLVWC